LVVSHADDDHAGGALSIAKSRDPPWLLTSLAPDDPLHDAFDHSVRCEAGLRWRWDDVDFAVLHPAREAYAPAPRRPRKENDRSCVLRVAAAGGAALLTGDIEARSEAEMLARDAGALAAQVLLVPHHGSKTSSTAAFIEAVRPRVGVLSVGYRNRFRHPAEPVVARYRSRGIVLRRTDEEGALRVVLPADAAGTARVEPLVAERGYWSERSAPR
ncbi:MAG TPA: MBL fold metallo-hydrolase, partial [Usitatibacter sp.]|nr:MBL fold metallo-hydrolase [Usitatibacter sp.]